MQFTNIKIKIPLGDKDITITAYKYTIESTKGDNEIDAYFLTPDVPENDPETRRYATGCISKGA
jgi:hypothetical protein